MRKGNRVSRCGQVAGNVSYYLMNLNTQNPPSLNTSTSLCQKVLFTLLTCHGLPPTRSGTRNSRSLTMWVATNVPNHLVGPVGRHPPSVQELELTTIAIVAWMEENFISAPVAVSGDNNQPPAKPEKRRECWPDLRKRGKLHVILCDPRGPACPRSRQSS